MPLLKDLMFSTVRSLSVAERWSLRRKNTETRNKFIPSYEIFAPSSEIIMKIINYCRKMIKNHEKNNKFDEKIFFQKTWKNMFYEFLFCHLESMFEQPNHFPDEQNWCIVKRSLQKHVQNVFLTPIALLNFNFTKHPFSLHF